MPLCCRVCCAITAASCESYGPEITGVPVSLDSVHIDASAGTAEIKGLVLGNPVTVLWMSVAAATLALLVGGSLGLLAGLVKSDLKVPLPIYETLSILLMLTLGLKGGMALHGVPLMPILPELGLIAATGVALPLMLYPLLRKLVRLNSANAASVAAHYGSVSAGTFAVAMALAMQHNLPMQAPMF